MFLKCRVISSYHKELRSVCYVSKDIYGILVTKVILGIVSKYDFNWPNIWKHLNFKYINVNDRNVMFKFIYEILPINKRLHQITIGESPLCEECEIEDTNSHRFYHCYKVQDCVKWMRTGMCGVGEDRIVWSG